jgi:NADH-quinone oxidoreductase subunit J
MVLRVWTGPSFLALILFVEFLVVLSGRPHALVPSPVLPKNVGLSLFGPYLLGVELAAMLLLAGIVGALHLGQRKKRSAHRFFENGGSQ